VWLYTTPEISSVAFVALYKTGIFSSDLVWHYTRLENTDEVWGGTVQDWRLYVKFGVALYKTKSTSEVWCCTVKVWRVQMMCSVVWHSKGIQSRNKILLTKRVVNRSCPSSFTPYPWNAYPMNSVLKLISVHFRAHNYMYSDCEHLIATDSTRWY